MKLDKEEKELFQSIERGEWKSISNLDSEKKRLQKIAQETLRKNKTINIRINEKDLNILKEKASDEGIPYQTFVTSILHKFIIGRFAEKTNRACSFGI